MALVNPFRHDEPVSEHAPKHALALAGGDADGLYRLIAETIPHMVWTARADGYLDFFNKRVHEYTGRDSASLEGWGWKSVIHPEDLDRCLASWTRALQSGDRYEIEYRLRRFDGSFRWHHGSAVPIRDREGRPEHWFGTCTDIEAEVRSAQILEGMIDERTRKLQDTERRFELFMEHLPGLAWIRDSELRHTYVNRFFRQRLGGLAPNEVLGREPRAVFPEATGEMFRKSDLEVQRSGSAMHFIEESHNCRWLKVKFPFPDAEGKAGVAGIALDVTDRGRLEAALLQSERRFRSFMDNAPAIAWIKDAGFRYTYVNRTHERLHGRTLADLLGRDDFEIWPRETAEQFRQHDIAALAAGGGTVQSVDDVPFADGTPGQWLVIKFPLPDAEGKLGVAGIGIDVSARIKAEELAQRYSADIRRLMDRLVAAQESERKRLADDLHDLIGQNLTALGIDLASVKQRLEGLDAPPTVGERIDAMKALVQTTMNAIRGVMTDLRPPALEEYGLAAALRWSIAEFGERTGMKATFSVTGEERRLAQATELALFRIAQEALTNAAKHSGGTSVHVSIGEQHGLIRLTVEDDGRGISDRVGARSARRGGWGLPAMRERAEAHGGELRIEFPERGTRLIVDIPAQRGA